MIRKILFLIALFTLVVAPLALADTQNFTVSVRIPRLLGLNYFPHEMDLADNTAASPLRMQESRAIRDGRAVVLQTVVAD